MVLKPKLFGGGNPLILGRPWLATMNTLIGCEYENMIISRGDSIKNVTFYPPTKTIKEETLGLENNDND